MKVYALPEAVPAPRPDYTNYDHKVEIAKEKQHQEDLKAYLQKLGYTGEHTGRIYRAQVADGYALYMFADGGAKSCVIHLPYGDAYQDRAISHMSRKAVIETMDAADRWDAFFT